MTQQSYRRAANAFVADFIGKANFLSTQVVGVASDRLVLDVLGRQLSIDMPNRAPCIGESATLLARPEAIILDVGGEGYPGRVSRAAYLGSVVEYEDEVAGEALVLTQYDPAEVSPVGAGVHVQLVKEALYLLPTE
jgi:iron(III) transport system ATP-binding protein